MREARTIFRSVTGFGIGADFSNAPYGPPKSQKPRSPGFLVQLRKVQQYCFILTERISYDR